MRRAAMIIVAAVGVASATPALGRIQEPECPEMPPTADIDRSRSGDVSLQFGGVGLGGSRSRSRTARDVMMREGGFEAWSAAAVMAHACQVNRRLYRNDPRRQRDEFAALRDRLVRDPPPRADPPSHSGGRTGWTFSRMWHPLATYPYMPRAALSAGLNQGTVQVDCRISQERGVDDCYLISESPRGYGFGAASAQYLGALRLRSELLSFSWAPRRLQINVTIASHI